MKNHNAGIIKRIFNTYKQHSQLKKNVLSGTAFSVCNTVITIISYPIYLKYLGVERYGLWSIVSVVFAFSQFGQMGIDTAVTKYVAHEYAKKNYRAITEYSSTSIYILLIPSLIVICMIVVFRSQIADFIKLSEVFREDGVRLILWTGFLSVFIFFVNVLKGVISGIGRMDFTNYIFLLGRVLQISVAIILLVFGYGVWSLYYGFLVYYLAPSIIWSVILRKMYQIKFFEFKAFNKRMMKELVGYGGTLVTGTIAHMFVIPFNKVIIGRYVGLSEVAYYQIAVQVVMSVRNLFVKGLEAILPKFSELYGNQSNALRDIFSVHKKGMRFIFLFAFPLFITIFIFAEVILKIWLGNEFDMQITVVMRILLVGWLINALAVPDYYMFLGIGKVGYGVSATCIKSITNVLLIFVLLILNIDFSLNKVVVVDAVSLAMAVSYLKFKYFEFKRINRAVEG